MSFAFQTHPGTTTYSRGALTIRLAQPEDVADPEAVMRARAVNESRVIAGGLERDGMVVHAIDAVLIPLGVRTALDEAEMIDDSPPQIADEVSGSANPAPEPENPAREIARMNGGTTTGIVPQPIDEPAPQTGGSDTFVTTTPESGAIAEIPPVVLMPEGLPAADVQRADQSGKDRDPATESVSGRTPAVELASDIISVSDLLERPVRNGAGENPGTVADLNMSLTSAQITSLAVLTDSGFLGLGEDETRQVAVTSVSIDPLDGAVIVPAEAMSSGARD